MFSPYVLRQRFEFRCFRPGDQEAARALILEGLAERWGSLDPLANPDLDDIARTYRQGYFLTAHDGCHLVGTGGIRPEGRRVYRVSRMSVRRQLRGAGLGTAILDELVRWAAACGAARVVLETTTEWEDAVRFYRNYGFRIVGEDGENTHFQLVLEKCRELLRVAPGAGPNARSFGDNARTGG